MKSKNRLEEARKAVNLTQEQVANALRCQKGTISNWENGHSNPSIEKAFILAELYGRDINWLFHAHKVQDTYTTVNDFNNK